MAPFGVGFLLSLGLVRVCRALAIRMGRVSHPRADRWHRRPVALLGGVGIALSLFVTAASFGLVSKLPVLLAQRSGEDGNRARRKEAPVFSFVGTV